jgi:lipoprotein-releasing system permease protein
VDFRFLIARRYLAASRRVTLVSIISGLSVAGVALGVTALIVVLSVMNGFYGIVRDLLVSFDPHVRIESAEGRGLTDVDSLLRVTQGIEGVESAAAYVEGKALLTYEGASDETQVVVVRGVAAEFAADSTEGVVASTTSGAFDVARRDGRAGIVVGTSLGLRLGLYPEVGAGSGSRVALLSAPGIERVLTQPLGLPPLQPFTVRGLYELEPVYDASHVFIGLGEAQRLFRMSESVSGIELRLDDLERARAVKAELQRRLGEGFRVQTWYDLQRSLYDVMRLEKWGASFVLALIIVVAAFNIVGSLTMIVIEKRRDLGALQAMGASRADIRRIFLLEGVLVGLLGSGVGLVLGLGIALAQQQFGLVPLAGAESFIIDAYPVAVRAWDVVLVVVVAVGLCAAASVYPAARAASVEPAQAVRGG